MVPLNSGGRDAFWSAIVFAVFAGIAVILRLLSKKWTKAAFGADDWWALASLVLFYAFVAVVIWGVAGDGGGANVGTADSKPDALKDYLMSLFIVLNLYFFTALAIKISILCLYRRIFIVRNFRRASLVTGLFVVALAIAGEVAALVSCVPVTKFWSRLEPGHCFNFDDYYIGIQIPDVILDTVILALPIRMIFTLQLSRTDQVTILGIFLLGGFVIITGILRITFVYQPHNNNVLVTNAELWGNIHLGTAIVCACLPTYRPLLAKAKVFSQSLRMRYGSLFSTERTIKSSKGTNVYPLNDCPKDPKPEDMTGLVMSV